MESFALLAFSVVSELHAVNVFVWYNESGVGFVCLFVCFFWLLVWFGVFFMWVC